MDGQSKKSAPGIFAKLGNWIWAIVAAVVLLLGVGTAILISTVGCKKAPENKEPEEGAETGVYYFDSVLGEYTLALNSGNKFSIAGPDLNKSGDYTVSGSTVTLDFVKDADGTAEAQLNGDRLTLVYQGSTLNFLRKVTYDVAFDTAGGTTLEPVLVINGKTVAKPADPTKEGFVFLGWYADSELVSAFDFGETPIYSATTVYAKWAEKVPGQDEFTVDFDLGYAAEAPASVTTVGGKLVFSADFVLPVREGYTFVGWFVSDYEDGAKLTYAASEGTVLYSDTTLFALWAPKTSDKLATPAVSVVGNTISWGAVDGANAYQVTVTDGAGNVLFDQSVGTTTQSFDFASADAGDYEVKVVAKGSKPDSDAAVRALHNKALNRVSGIRVVGSTLVFDAVDGAQKYLITIDCGNKEHSHTLFDNGKSTYYNFENCAMQPDGISFTITAVADGYASSQSKTFTLVRNLAAVEEVTYDAATATFRWTGVADAVKYLVTVTCNGKTVTVDNGTATTLSVKDLTGEVTISVLPVSAGYNSPKAAELKVTKTTPATPGNILLSDMSVTWDAAEGAKSYIVRVNGTSYPVSGTTFNLRDTGISFVTGAIYEITVQSVGDTEQSVVSDALKAPYLSMGSVFYGENTVSWAPVIGVSRFEVRVNGGESIFVTGANGTKIVLTKAGINTVEVRTANFATDTEWKALEVKAYSVTYESRTVSGSVTEYLAKGDTMLLPDSFTLAGFEFNGWYNTPSAAEGNGSAYVGTVFEGNGDTVLYANWSPKSYQIKIIGVDDTMSGAKTDDTVKVIYTKDFTLPVLTTTDTIRSSFAGWYTGPGGTGTKLTDYLGQSVSPYGYAADSLAYPYFTSGLEYVLKDDNTYAVKKGADIDTIQKVTIPVSYNGIAVTSILENGFYGCDSLISIDIPDTIKLIGTGAFSSCNALEALNVYEVQTDTPHEVFYHSCDGALLYDDAASGYTYLEVFPRGKKGAFTVPADVDIIRSRAFNYSKISSLTISKEVLIIGDYAFSNSRSLKSIAFEEGRTTPISVSVNAFSGCYSVKSIHLPALVKGSGEDEAFDVTTLNTLTSLETITVEKVTGALFSAVDGMLCNDLGDTILYCPLGYTGNGSTLTIPKGITAIGESIFSGRNAFTSVIIPSYVTEIGKSAFYGCRKLTTITFEGDRSRDLTVGDAAFYGCTSVKEVIFEANDAASNGAITIGAYAFSGSTSLRTLTVEAGVNLDTIGAYAFDSDTKLRTITLDETATVKTIGDGAFRGCEGLISFTIPASTTSIGDSAFANCTYLSKIVFAPNGQNIDFGSYVFKECVGLTSVELPATVQSFDGSAFDGCDSLRTITVDSANPYLTTAGGILYDKNKTEIMFYPKGIADATLANLPWDTLTKIGNSVFKNNASITSVTIPKSVTSIGNSAFEGCVNLAQVTVENGGSALTVGDYAFAECPALTAIELPVYTSGLGEGAFYNTPLDAFVVPAGVKSIGDKAFMYTNLTSVNIPASVTSIGDGAFAYSKLTSVTFEEGSEALTVGGKTDIEISYNFESYDFNTSNTAKHFPVDYIGKAAIGTFTGTALTTLNLPARLTDIGAFAFYKVETLKTVTVSDGSKLSVIGDGAFYGSGVETFELGKTSVTTIGEFAFAEAKLTAVTFPNTVTVIEKYAFANNGARTSKSGSEQLTPSLKQVEFATGGTAGLTVKANAFFNSAFTTITFPARLENCSETIHVVSAQSAYWVSLGSFYRVVEGNYDLAEINVEDGCAKYQSIDGVLYEKDGDGKAKTLLFCPPAKTGEVTIPNTVTLVDHKAFYCTQLTKITFEEFAKDSENYGKPLLSIGSASTASSSAFSYGVFGGGNDYMSYAKYKSTAINNATAAPATKLQEIVFPSHLKLIASYGVTRVTTEGFKVTFNMDASPISLNQKAFFSNPGLTELHLPAVKSLSPNATSGSTFSSNENMTTVTFGKGTTVTEFPESLFLSCKALKSIEIPASVTSMTGGVQGCFENCTSLTQITFEEGTGIATIGSRAFKNTGLTEFTFPDSVISVGEKVFENCQSLKKVTIGAGMTSTVAFDSNGTSSSIFYGNASIEEYAVAKNHPTLAVEDGVLYDIAKSIVFAFPPAKDVTGYTIPLTVKEIYNYAFYLYNGTEITLPEGLTRIGYGAFMCSALTSVNIPASVKEIDGAAFSATASAYAHMTEVTFAPNSQLTTIGRDAFYYQLIQTIELPDNVTSIGRTAFSYCNNLESVILPAGLKTLGQYAFQRDKKLASVTIQEQLETIEYGAFNYCDALTRVDLPASLVSIGSSAFYSCKKLETVTFGEGSRLTTIEGSAFGYCSALKEIVFPAGVSSIGARLFASCTSLEYIDLSEVAVTELESDTSTVKGFFAGCTALKTVLLPKQLEVIDADAFKDCSSLTAIEIPATVTEIRDSAFDGCSSLASVTIPGTSILTAVGKNAFRGTASLTSISFPDAVDTIGDSAFEGSGLTAVALPASLSEIGTAMFKGCEGLTEIAVPATVTSIGDEAFRNCTNLTAVNIPEGVEYIGTDAFGDCGKLESITIPSTVVRMGGNPFSNCMGLTNFVLAAGNDSFVIDQTGVLYDANMRTVIFYPSYVTSEVYEMPGTVFELSASAFAGSQLKRVTISDNIKVIPEGCFKGSVLLESITIPESVNQIGAEAFQGCVKLDNVAIPGSCTEIGDSAFEGCAALTAFDFGTRNTSLTVGKALFRDCVNLQDAVLPEGLTAIPEYMFANTGIVNLVIPSSVKNLKGDGLFMNCTKLVSVEFPQDFEPDKNATGFGKYTFYGCTSLESIVLPDTLQWLDAYDFMNCTSLESVTFGTGLLSIGVSCFENCTSLLEADLSETGLYGFEDFAFRNCTSLKTIKLNPDCYDIYCCVFAGCTSLEGEIELPYCWLYGGLFAGCTKIEAVHITGWDWFENYYDDDGNTIGNFYGWTAEQKVYFDENTYEDIVDYFFGDSEADNLMVGSQAQVFDCDGNQIFYDSETGTLICVKDSEGNIIYEP